MATIGIVTRTAKGAFKGTLQTLMMKAQIDIVPNEEKTSDAQPDYRVIAKGGFELGAGWIRHNREQQAYISLSLAAPEFGGGRLYANLGRAPDSEETEERYAVIWNPPSTRQ
jgi:uncharacterized protein (DUF736 family)